MSEPTREGTKLQSLEAVTRLSVVVARGPGAGAMVTTEPGASASVGTADDNDLRLGDPTVSRYHLELRPTPAGIVVTDLDSTNGTFAGGIRLRSAIVPRGAQLRLGDTVIVVDGAGSGPAPTAPLDLPGMAFVSESMHEVARRVRGVAPLTGAVLVHGETGTGKELVSRAIHDLGPRAKGPFVTVDCGSLPASLLEAELFGHERGAFTGAERTRPGAFERADGGTLFLDEVGELPLPAQAALLGVLDRRRFRRLGGDREITVSVRITSATNRDLRSEVNRGTFRADLYYRLAGARIALPPLRARPEDVAILARRFALELTGDEGALGDDVLETLGRQTWPGNVRELRAAVEQVLAFGVDELPAPVPTPDPELDRYRDAKAAAIESFDRGYLGRLLEATEGNVSEAARRARMDRPYLTALLKRYDLRPSK